MNRPPNSEYIQEKLLPFCAVHGERQTGKTTALLTAMERNDHGRAIVVAMSTRMAQELRYRWEREPHNIRFLGSSHSPKAEPYPRFVSGDTESILRALEGNPHPVYVDEWWMLPKRIQVELIESGRIKAAVGTVPHGEVIPLFHQRPRTYFEAMRANLMGCTWTKDEAVTLKSMIDLGTRP